MKINFKVETATPFELVDYCSLLTSKDVDEAKQLWQALYADVIALREQQLSPPQRWHVFKQLFYSQWQFSIASDDYFSLPRNNLFSLMTDRKGNNSLITIIINELLGLLDLETRVVDFPGSLIIELVGDDGFFFDPLTGEQLTNARMEVLLRGHLGDYHRLNEYHLVTATADAIKKRYLVCIKQSCLLEKKFEQALYFSELLLEIIPDDPQQRMERGFVLQQLECYEGALEDFSFFIDNCPDDPNSDVLKMHIKTLNQQTNIFH
ncbi:MAG: tetratricopeptide repeat protein [Gammaproteobacteria bacterium]|nr:tetratricopeptide repeat protein [Gammaproteobacteria bacterium]